MHRGPKEENEKIGESQNQIMIEKRGAVSIWLCVNIYNQVKICLSFQKMNDMYTFHTSIPWNSQTPSYYCVIR